MPRFVILQHDHPFPHHDLMLEAGAVLRTWRLHGFPHEDEVRAEPLGDHRLAYLDYEGPVSGGRGRVRREEAGEYTLLADQPDLVRIELIGRRLRGVLELRRQGHDWVA